MSLTIKDIPFVISFAANPVVFELEPINLYINGDVFPSLKITFTDVAAVGEGFSFQIKNPENGQTILLNFVAVASPDESGHQYSVAPEALADYAETNSDIFKKSTLLATHFEVVYSSGDEFILFRAKEPLSELVPTDFVHNGTWFPAHTHLTNEISDLFLPKKRFGNYRVRLDVYFEKVFGSNNWERVAQLEDEPDNDDLVRFDISSILDAEVLDSYDEPPVPVLNDSAVKIDDLKRRYYCSWEDFFDEKVSSDKWFIDEARFVHAGGISIEDFAKQDPFQYLQLGKKFLSWGVDNKKLTIPQKDWLTWINYTGIDQSFEIKYQVYFNDTTDSGVLTLSAHDLVKWDSLLIPIGYTQLDLGAIAPAKTVFKWLVWIQKPASATIYSEKKSFFLAAENCFCENTLLFLNSYYTPETIITVGEWTKSLKTTKQIAEKVLVHKYKTINGQQFQFDDSSQNMFKARSGLLTQKEQNRYQDLLMEENLFLLDDCEVTPIIVEAGSFEIKECNKFLSNIDFKVRKSMRIGKYSETNRSPLLVPILECGWMGVEVDLQGQTVQGVEYADLSIFDANGASIGIDDISWSGGSLSWVFEIQREGDYFIECEIETDKGTWTYYLKYQLRFAHAGLVSIGSSIVVFYLRTISADRSAWFDWGVGDVFIGGHEEFTITTTPAGTPVNKLYNQTGNKSIDLYTSCPEDFDIFSSDGGFLTEVDVSMFVNLTVILIVEPFLSGNIDISAHKKLVLIAIQNTQLTSIQIGHHPDVTIIQVHTNQIGPEERENFIEALWDYRKYMNNPAILVNISANPGTTTARTMDLILGTGAFIGEGLNSYGFTVII